MNRLHDYEAWYFVFHTNKYSGNFERPAVAYITGQVGECDVGKEEAKIAKQEITDESFLIDMEEFVIHSLDENYRCMRPATIWYTPEAKAYNGVAVGFDTDILCYWETLVARAKAYCEKNDIEFKRAEILYLPPPSARPFYILKSTTGFPPA